MARYSSSKQVHGTWMILECQAHSADDLNLLNLKGLEFSLDKGGSVFWRKENDVDFPPSYCDTYEVHSSSFSTFIRFAGFHGNIIEFRLEKPSHQEMILSFDLWIIITCKRKLSSHQTNLDNNFTLYPALEDGCFSDMEIRASSGQTFQVHKTVLVLSVPESKIDLLNGLPEAVLSTTLHFFYSHHLPSTLSSSTAKLCIEQFEGEPCMSKLVEFCRCFLKDTALRKEIENLVKSMHTSLERMVHLFDTNSESDMLVNAARLWQSVKSCSGEVVMVVVHFIQLCVTYLKSKNELSADERREMLSYFRSRLPVFVSQVYRLLKYLKNVVGGLSASQNFVLASYIAPEVNGALSIIWALAIECKNITEQIIYSCRSQSPTGHSFSDTLLEKEIHKLKNFHEKLLLAVMFLSHKKEKFAEMSVASQVRLVMRNINLFVEEIPLVIFRLEEIIASLDISLSQSEFQFTFYNVASKISQAISRLRDLKAESNVRWLLQQICDLVQREELNNALCNLDLLDGNSGSSSINSAPPPPASFLLAEEATAFNHLPDHLGNVELSLFGPMCHEPMASQSALARSVLQLLETEDNVDFEFILPADSGSSSAAQILKAHRVVLAARCHWFHRALLSGMREAIDRKITLPDCSASLMSMFLRYLYGESLDQVNINNDQLIELLILADRFEVAQLSSGCQTVLTSRLDLSNVLCLLAIADQWSATQLQVLTANSFQFSNFDIICIFAF